MFGHLDLDFAQDREFDLFQCSLCHALGKRYGVRGRFLTNTDLALCLLIGMKAVSAEVKVNERLCPAFSRKKTLDPYLPVLKYVAAVTVLLMSEKTKDDLHDEGSRLPQFTSNWLSKMRAKAEADLRNLNFSPDTVANAFRYQRLLEQRQDTDLDSLSEPTARVTSAIYSHIATIQGVPKYERALAQIGRSLGRIIYLLDSIADYRRDVIKGIFNPLHACFQSAYAGNANAHHVSDRARESVALALKSAQNDISQAVKQLPENPVLDDILVKRIQNKIEACLGMMGSPPPNHRLSNGKICTTVQLSPLISPAVLFASEDRDFISNCIHSSLFPPAVLIFEIFFVCKGGVGKCCVSHPETVTVDQGCGSKKTYRRDSCTGKYKEDKYC